MIARFALASILLCGPTLPGCDFLTTSPEPPSTAVLTEIVIESAPLFKPDGGRWDGGLNPSGPDLVLVLRDSTGNTEFTTRDPLGGGIEQNADEFSFPVEYPLGDRRGERVAGAELDMRFFAELRDADFGGSELMVELGSFVLGPTRPEIVGRSTVTTLVSPDRSATVRLFWAWQE